MTRHAPRGQCSDWNAAPVQDAIKRGLAGITRARKCAGIIALLPEDEDKYAALCARYFANVSTAIITRALKQAATAGREGELRY